MKKYIPKLKRPTNCKKNLPPLKKIKGNILSRS